MSQAIKLFPIHSSNGPGLFLLCLCHCPEQYARVQKLSMSKRQEHSKGGLPIIKSSIKDNATTKPKKVVIIEGESKQGIKNKNSAKVLHAAEQSHSGKKGPLDSAKLPNKSPSLNTHSRDDSTKSNKARKDAKQITEQKPNHKKTMQLMAKAGVKSNPAKSAAPKSTVQLKTTHARSKCTQLLISSS